MRTIGTIAAVVDALSRNTSVTSLDIFELDPVAASALADVLSAASPRITGLAVHHPHGLGAVQNLCRGIASSCSLTSLHLSQLDSKGVDALANALLAWSDEHTMGFFPRLQHLRLEKCTFSPDVAASLASALGRQAGSLAQLEVLDSALGDTAAEALLGTQPGLAQLQSLNAPEIVAASTAVLHTLDLPACNVGPRGAAQLGRLLAATHSLHSLNLSNNKSLGCEGVRALAAGLAANRTLLRLDMSGSGIGATGVKDLATALRPDGGGGGGPPLQQLMLGFNAAGATGLAALLGAMSGPQPCALRNLQLDHNHVRGVELTEALQEALVPPPAQAATAAAAQPPPLSRLTAQLKQLSLAGNALYDVGVAALAAFLTEAPSSLELLDLRENGISDAGVAALLPLIAPRCNGSASAPVSSCRGGGAQVQAAAPMAAGAAGLQGLLLDGNRLHNAGAKVLLEAVTAAPGLWKFSAEANKLTDPALRLSLTQLSQLRAARHSQWVVLGRYNSSSSSSSSDDGGDRHSGGSGGDRRSGGGGSGNGSRRSHEATSAMDVDDAATTQAPLQGSGSGGSGGTQPQANQQQLQHLKHRLDEVDAATDGCGAAGSGGGEGACSQDGDDGRQLPSRRNVVARGPEEPPTSALVLPPPPPPATTTTTTSCTGSGVLLRGAGGGGCGDGDGVVVAMPSSSSSGVSQPRGLQRTATAAAVAAAVGDRPTATAWVTCSIPTGGGGRGMAAGSGSCVIRKGNVPANFSTSHCFGPNLTALFQASVGVFVYGICSFSSDTSMMLQGGDGGGDGGCSGNRHYFAAAAAATGVASSTSPPAGASCYVATVGMMGVGGDASVRTSKRASQRLLSAYRAPRYKALTPEQQRLFEDF
ncbi:hypothetical protein VOLCADRAFT_88209 [Volvox carteri f. nagariensis]|uniref:Uncharacterized protein n=1 Tax=Volvox carteri f. nagariensis TaxID=3068 RepID=D8TNK4_VOLCA|nr:uncharacterized protein VOLCADRAFT_88209 [Volvox carteri f. nagariensis]EFJ51005.1 hypothetical protein VOLCADRAFT_88209 [Volvox carteri f. nagariensis]|eukprot:XP_002948017.1 hypothetical protein VOLCADRAFT_88209 [Volvox carteri f. nagariensis]